MNRLIFLESALTFMRVGIGILTIGHGIPKILGGLQTWNELGKFLLPLHITFWPTFWGFVAACVEFFGGIMLVAGFGTRIASFFLIQMMVVAFIWHLSRKDSFTIYSFPLSLIVVYLGFLIVGSGPISLDRIIFH